MGSPWLYTHDRCFVWAARELRYAYLEDGGFAEYRYNENGLRSLKKIDDENGIDSDYYYYFWSDDGRLLAYTVDQYGSEDLYSVLVLYNSDKEPIGFTVGEDTYYYLKNIQGDVLCVTDAEGTPIVNYTYDAWGMMTVSPASQNVPSATVVTVAFLNPVTYRGYFYDYELGLYYLQSRYYDPETGRFISADSLLETGKSIVAANSFAYCENNAVIHEDRSGNFGENIKIRNFLGLGFSNTGDWFKKPWTTTTECLQAHLGYCDLYDKASPLLGCFIDWLISEFNYNSKNWRVEFWKGRYGINRGAEIGFYNRNEKAKFLKGFYVCLKKKEGFVDMDFTLYESNNKKCSYIFDRNTDSGGHWWLTGFLFDGWLSFTKGHPDNLVLDANITFYSSQMAKAFNNNLGKKEGQKTGGFKASVTGANVNVVWAPENGFYSFYDKDEQFIKNRRITNA